MTVLRSTYYPTASIWKIDPADGSHDATYSAPTSDYVYGMAFDAPKDAGWADTSTAAEIGFLHPGSQGRRV